jgi:hypothetical protein
MQNNLKNTLPNSLPKSILTCNIFFVFFSLLHHMQGDCSDRVHRHNFDVLKLFQWGLLELELFPIPNYVVWRLACLHKAFIQHATSTSDNNGESDAEDATPTTTLYLDVVCVEKKRPPRHVRAGILESTTMPPSSLE